MSPIKNVALAGATGNLGPSILTALSKSGFNVTVLTRDASKVTDLPAGAKAVTVDYSSPDSIKAAIAGADAVVSTLSPHFEDAGKALADAAAAAGVQRYIPSEFGCDYNYVGEIPIFQGKVRFRKHVEELAKKHGLTYTYIVTNAFLDWGLKGSFILSLNQPSVEIYDGGDVPFSANTLAAIGQAVVGVLQHPAETKNRAVFIADAVVTQNQLLKLAEEESGKTWEVKPVDCEERHKEAIAELQKEKPNVLFATFSLILRTMFGGPKYHNLFSKEELDNDLLGIKTLTDAELRQIVKDAVA